MLPMFGVPDISKADSPDRVSHRLAATVDRGHGAGITPPGDGVTVP